MMEQIHNMLIEAEYSVLEISRMSKNEMFENLMNYEGYSYGCQCWIKSLIRDLYDINLDAQ